MLEVVKSHNEDAIRRPSPTGQRKWTNWIAVLLMVTVFFAIASTWFVSVEYHWERGFAALSGGHLFVIDHGWAPWMVGWRVTLPDWDDHRVDWEYDELAWDRVLVWQIAELSWPRTVIPIWPLMVLCLVGTAFVTGAFSERRFQRHKIVFGAITRGMLILVILAMGYGPLDRWLSGTNTFHQINWLFYVSSRALGLFVVVGWTARRLKTKLRAKEGCCNVCGYDLRGNLSGICPECGTLIAPTN